MYSEEDLLPISALQHFLFCPRQWGLIHLEQAWSENLLTAEGRLLHDKAHESETENRPDLRIVRGLRLCSYRLGLTGQADVVEFYKTENGIMLDSAAGLWQLVPVEYKRGNPKIDTCDEVQICAQALCLEEMLKTNIERGFIFYGKPRRRQQVDFTATLRRQTEQIVQELHRLIADKITPRAKYGKKCKSCSLFELCMPKVIGIEKDIGHYLAKAKNITLDESE
jgi:CRISPR-associated exonuclease Cas4